MFRTRYTLSAEHNFADCYLRGCLNSYGKLWRCLNNRTNQSNDLQARVLARLGCNVSTLKDAYRRCTAATAGVSQR